MRPARQMTAPELEPFAYRDIDRFLELARRENWVAEAWELEFLLDAFPAGCFSIRDHQGETAAFVTALRHSRSGWIGNLIVAPEKRGLGWGEALFLGALAALRHAGVETAWLTASAMGRALYQRHGFATIDTIIRWTGRGTGPATDQPPARQECDGDIDYLGWGDRRDQLLAAVARRSRPLLNPGGFAMVQSVGASAMVGPFAMLDPVRASLLLDAAMGAIPQGTKVLLDVPQGNPLAAPLLQDRGFRPQGRNELMFAGVRPLYRPQYIFALATMGSCG